MRRLALLPLVIFAVACSDSTLVQPENDLSIAAAARAARTVLIWQEVFDQPWAAGEQLTTPSLVLHWSGIDNGFFVTGDLEGYSHVRGYARIDLVSGKGNTNLTVSYDITEYLSEPVDGGFECVGTTKITGFPAALVQEGQFNCKGTGDFAGLHMKATGTNENLPAYQMTAEIW